MDGHVNCRCSDMPPVPRGIHVRLVGGPADGRTHVIKHPDDVRYIVVPAWGDEGGLRQVRYLRVMDKQGLRYVVEG